MRFVSHFSTRFPKLIIFAVLAITAFFAYQFKTKSYIESDMSKFLPTDMVTVKANDYYRKNFSYKDSLIIGIESEQLGIMNPDVLKAIEKIVDDIKGLKTTKVFYSQLSGKEVTIELPIGIDTDDITSISGLEDAILDRETGAVVSGSVIKKLKKEAGIPFTDQDEARLPESNADLLNIMPALKKHIFNDRLFKGNVLSENEKATAIHVPMINKWAYKQRFASLELATAIDPKLLKERFQGKDSTFPFEVYGKTIGRTTYDDAYINKHTTKLSEELKDHLEDFLSPTFDTYPELKELFDQELTSQSFQKILQITQEKDFFQVPEMTTWENFVNKLYEFMLVQIDPLSLENLEFQLADTNQIYDLLKVYDDTRIILERHTNDQVKSYVAGQPVAMAEMARIIDNDMGMLMPMGVVVILLMLAISFKSVVGVVIPLLTVVLSVIWALGFQAMTGTPITTSTSIVPIILLAVGSAYGIHFLNRYREDARTSDDRRVALRFSIEGVGVAIILAGLTTFFGFLSLSTSSLAMIRHFSLFSAFGIIVALLLTLTLSPAILCFWKKPKAVSPANSEGKESSDNLFTTGLIKWATMVKNHPKRIVTVFLLISIGGGSLLTKLQFEGGLVEDLQPDNPLRMSDEFINRNLTGTGQINLLFKFRDQLNLEDPWARKELKARASDFSQAWDNAMTDNRMKGSSVDDLKNRIVQITNNELAENGELMASIALMNNLLNEEFTVESEETSEMSADDSEGLDDLMELDETAEVSDEDLEVLGETDADESLEDLGGLGELADEEQFESSEESESAFADYSIEQVNGLKQLNQLLGQEEENWEATGKLIVQLRHQKDSEIGQQMMLHWNLLQDLFAMDIKQPVVLHKLEDLRNQLISMSEPQIIINGQGVNPTGFITGPVDMIRKTYSVFYHDENPDFKKIPNTKTDQLADPTLTDRGVIGVVLNQAQSSNRDVFSSMISSNLKEFQYSIMVRSSTTTFANVYMDELKALVNDVFPENDPYIESFSIGGQVPVSLEIMNMIALSQLTSIAQAMLFVFVITFFIFRSALGGLYSLIPLAFTILANFGMMILLGWKINTGTVLVASISIGIGVDYTIHFLERFKAQLKSGDPFDIAYFATIKSVGKAILINAISVAAGFMVLLASEMGGIKAMGVLMFGTMAYSSLAALTLLPAVIFVTKPRFLTSVATNNKSAVANAN